MSGYSAVFIPEELEDYGLNPIEYRIMCHALRYESNNKEWDYHSFESCRISDSELDQALRVLHTAGLIAWHDGARGCATYPTYWEPAEKLDAIREEVVQAIASSKGVRL